MLVDYEQMRSLFSDFCCDEGLDPAADDPSGIIQKAWECGWMAGADDARTSDRLDLEDEAEDVEDAADRIQSMSRDINARYDKD